MDVNGSVQRRAWKVEWTLDGVENGEWRVFVTCSAFRVVCDGNKSANFVSRVCMRARGLLSHCFCTRWCLDTFELFDPVEALGPYKAYIIDHNHSSKVKRSSGASSICWQISCLAHGKGLGASGLIIPIPTLA